MNMSTPPLHHLGFGSAWNISQQGIKNGWDLEYCKYVAWLNRGESGKAGVIQGTGKDVFVIVNNDPQYETTQETNKNGKLITEKDYDKHKNNGGNFLYECNAQSKEPPLRDNEVRKALEEEKGPYLDLA